MEPVVEVWSTAAIGQRVLHRVSVVLVNRLPSIEECAGWQPHPVWVGWLLDDADRVIQIPETIGLTDAPYEAKDRAIFRPLAFIDLEGESLIHGVQAGGWVEGPSLYRLTGQSIDPVAETVP
jgi:hypothetical protein